MTITGSYGAASRTVNLTVNPGAPPAPAAPSLISPANLATVSQPVTFDWSDVANAASYTIQIDNSSNFTNPLILSQSVSVSQATIGGLPAQQLFWRVRGINSAGANGPFSSTRRFTVQGAPSGPLSAPSRLTPANDARFNPGQAITFDWSNVAGASTYTIQIDDRRAFRIRSR